MWTTYVAFFAVLILVVAAVAFLGRFFSTVSLWLELSFLPVFSFRHLCTVLRTVYGAGGPEGTGGSLVAKTEAARCQQLVDAIAKLLERPFSDWLSQGDVGTSLPKLRTALIAACKQHLLRDQDQSRWSHVLRDAVLIDQLIAISETTGPYEGGSESHCARLIDGVGTRMRNGGHLEPAVLDFVWRQIESLEGTARTDFRFRFAREVLDLQPAPPSAGIPDPVFVPSSAFANDDPEPRLGRTKMFAGTSEMVESGTLRDFARQVREEEGFGGIYGLAGPRGCGKSTILHYISLFCYRFTEQRNCPLVVRWNVGTDFEAQRFLQGAVGDICTQVEHQCSRPPFAFVRNKPRRKKPHDGRRRVSLRVERPKLWVQAALAIGRFIQFCDVNIAWNLAVALLALFLAILLSPIPDVVIWRSAATPTATAGGGAVNYEMALSPKVFYAGVAFVVFLGMAFLGWIHRRMLVTGRPPRRAGRPADWEFNPRMRLWAKRIVLTACCCLAAVLMIAVPFVYLAQKQLRVGIRQSPAAFPAKMEELTVVPVPVAASIATHAFDTTTVDLLPLQNWLTGPVTELIIASNPGGLTDRFNAPFYLQILDSVVLVTFAFGTMGLVMWAVNAIVRLLAKSDSCWICPPHWWPLYAECAALKTAPAPNSVDAKVEGVPGLGTLLQPFLPKSITNSDMATLDTPFLQDRFRLLLADCQRVFGRVIILIDDIDTLPFERFAEFFRVIRPIARIPEVVCLVCVPTYFAEAARRLTLGDLHSTFRQVLFVKDPEIPKDGEIQAMDSGTLRQFLRKPLRRVLEAHLPEMTPANKTVEDIFGRKSPDIANGSPPAPDVSTSPGTAGLGAGALERGPTYPNVIEWLVDLWVGDIPHRPDLDPVLKEFFLKFSKREVLRETDALLHGQIEYPLQNRVIDSNTSQVVEFIHGTMDLDASPTRMRDLLVATRETIAELEELKPKKTTSMEYMG
jgi:hypothetical protein